MQPLPDQTEAEDDEGELADGEIEGEAVERNDGEEADPASEQNNSKQIGTGERAKAKKASRRSFSTDGTSS